MAPAQMSIAAAAALLAIAPQGTGPFEEDLALALGAAGLTLESARLDLDTLAFYREAALPCLWTGRFQARPWRAPFEADMARRQFAVAKANPGLTVEIASRLLGEGTRLALLGDPASGVSRQASAPDSLQAALAKMREAGLLAGPAPDLSAVPADARRAAAGVLFAALAAHERFRAATLSISDLAAHRAAWEGAAPDLSSPVAAVRAHRLFSAFERNSMFACGQEVGHAVVWAEAQARLVPASAKYDVRIETAWGGIVLTGGSDSRHAGEPPLLAIDTGGNDVYAGWPRTGGGQHWLSVVLDTAGDDAYVSDAALLTQAVREDAGRAQGRKKAGPGSATFGVTFLVDSSGDDLYRSTARAFGSAAFGVACLLDAAGNDVYDAYADSLGYGWCGIGTVEDLDGDDEYRVFTQGQGCGMPMGFGALLDRKGNDKYKAEDETIDFPSPQTAEHNVSLAQGAGYGVRADFSTGMSLAGGVGLLYDEEGDDLYECGVFGQGVGYWDGTGLLWDGAGRDTYRGQWYVQGASAHFGVGYLEDLQGDDSYFAGMNMALGAGHDFGLGYMLDHEGDDRYRGPNLSLGAGNANGIGVFFDGGGDDVYEASGLALGSAAEGQKASLRERAPSFGIFLDHSGADTYPAALSWAVNATKAVNWASRQPTPETSQVGVFFDRP
jgi:hypothetical protein